MAATYAAAAFLFSLAVYVSVSVWGKRDSLSIYSFFHDSGRPWMAVVSLTAYNVTLGTGVAYLLVQAKNTGLLVLLTPIGITAGYFAAAWYYGRLNFKISEHRPNLYYLLANEVSPDRFRLGFFPTIFSAFIATTFFLLLCFELGVGSGFIGATLFKTPSKGLDLAIAVLIFAVVIVYTAISGLRAAVNTDIAQFVFVIAFVAIVPYIISRYGAPIDLAVRTPEFSPPAVLGALLAILTAISTQFYSIVNPQLVTTYSPADQRRILGSAGVLSGLIYLVVAWIGLTTPSQDSLEASIRSFLYDPANSSLKFGVIAFLLFAGMLAILLSTLDNLCIAVTQFYYDLAFSRRDGADDSKKAVFDIKRFRVIYIIVGLAVVPVTIFFYLSFQNIFYLLLTILFAAGVLSPSVFTAIFLRATDRTTLLDNKMYSTSLLLCTAIGWVVYLVLSVKGMALMGTAFHLAAFAVGGTVACVDYYKNRALKEIKRVPQPQET